MKSLLILLYLLTAIVIQSPSKNPAESLQPVPPHDGNAMDHPVLIGERPRDHPVLIGERPRDSMGGVEHLAPLIFMVMAFLVTVIVGVILWRKNTWIIPSILAAIFALVTFLLLANVNFYVSDQHPDVDISSHNHHQFEMFLSLAACGLMLVLFLFISKFLLQYILLFAAGIAELIVIVILLNIFPHHQYYKICNEQCVMLGSQAGVTFDLPCADNVAFMALHHTTGITPQDFRTTYVQDGELPHFTDYSTAIAMHDPLYPAVRTIGGNLRSEDITFSLYERSINPVATCSLYVHTRRHTKAEIEDPSFTFPYLPENTSTLVGVWSRSGGVLTRTFPAASVADVISHTGSYPAEANKVTFVSYKFKVAYLNPDGETQTPDEDSEVTFVLQDFYSTYPDHPAPVYSQGDMRDVMDIVFIPAQNDADTGPLDAAFFNGFRSSCRSIILDAVFQEPSIRYWRKHFNFWINPAAGRASDGRCGDCCHVQPANIDYIPGEIEFRALLHSAAQLDFTDHCNGLFSAEMHLIDDNNEKSSFLHELGHAAFGLCDEYPGGFNYQATDHLPNNWESRRNARTDAPMRHKDHSDVVRLHY